MLLLAASPCCWAKAGRWRRRLSRQAPLPRAPCSSMARSPRFHSAPRSPTFWSRADGQLCLRIFYTVLLVLHSFFATLNLQNGLKMVVLRLYMRIGAAHAYHQRFFILATPVDRPRGGVHPRCDYGRSLDRCTGPDSPGRAAQPDRALRR